MHCVHKVLTSVFLEQRIVHNDDSPRSHHGTSGGIVVSPDLVPPKAAIRDFQGLSGVLRVTEPEKTVVVGSGG